MPPVVKFHGRFIGKKYNLKHYTIECGGKISLFQHVWLTARCFSVLSRTLSFVLNTSRLENSGQYLISNPFHCGCALSSSFTHLESSSLTDPFHCTLTPVRISPYTHTITTHLLTLTRVIRSL